MGSGGADPVWAHETDCMHGKRGAGAGIGIHPDVRALAIPFSVDTCLDPTRAKQENKVGLDGNFPMFFLYRIYGVKTFRI